MTKSIKTLFAAALIAIAAFVGLANAGGIALAASPSTVETQSQDAPNDTITLTQPAPNTVIAETDDYATQALGDPWDMTTSPAGDLRNWSGLNDMDRPYHYTTPSIANGIWSATTTATGGSSFHLQYQNYTVGYSSLGEQDGQNFPIDSNRFSRFLIRMYSGAAFAATTYWYKNHEDAGGGAPVGNSRIFNVTPGWHIYSVDMRPGGSGGNGNWATGGPYTGYMVQGINSPSGTAIQVDWARLTPDTGATVRILWTYSGSPSTLVHLYLSPSADASANNELELAAVAASSGAYSWNTTGVAPGTYYIHASFNGAVGSIGPLVVNTTPVARIDAPSPLTGEDWGYARRNEGWDGSNPNQFQQVVQVANLVFNGAEIRGTPTGGDVQLAYLNLDYNNRVDSSRYRYFSQRMELDAPATRTDSPWNAGPRLIWDDGDRSFPTSKFILWPYGRYLQRFWDLPTMPMANGGSNQWNGQQITFRMDPLEEDDSFGRPPILPASFGLTNAHLTSMPIAGKAGSPGSNLFGTVIRWTTMQGRGTISFYRDNNNSGFDGTPIVTGIPISQGTYNWFTDAVPAGTYYIYAIADDGTNSSRFYSLVPIKVDQTQFATIFTDVPNNYWAVEYINRLGMRNIVGGSSQPDTTLNFRPASTATRAQLSKIVVVAAAWALLNPASPTFADVAVGSTFYQYVETAADHGVTNGYACGGVGEPCDGQNRRYFRPSNSVTRAQTAKMVSVSRGWTIISPPSATFADMPYDGAQGSLYSFVETAVSKGIVNGYPCGGAGEPCDGQNRPYYRPGNSVTRAQLSKMISIALDVVVEKSGK